MTIFRHRPRGYTAADNASTDYGCTEDRRTDRAQKNFVSSCLRVDLVPCSPSPPALFSDRPRQPAVASIAYQGQQDDDRKQRNEAGTHENRSERIAIGDGAGRV